VVERYKKGFASAWEEATWVVNKVCELVHSGVRCRDIVVVLCDFDRQKYIYKQLMDENNILVNVDISINLLSQASAQFVKDHLELELTGGLASYISIIKNINSGLSKEEEFDEENRVLKGGKRSELAKKVIDENVLKILELIPTDITPREHLNVFCALCSAIKVSEIPELSDAVTLVGLSEHVAYSVPYLFVVGASEESFPATQSDTDIITGQDIGNMSVLIEPSPILQSSRNHQHAVNVLQSATKELYTTYTREPSNLLKGEEPDTKIASKSYATDLVLRAIADGEAFEDIVYWNSILRSLDIGDKKIDGSEVLSNPRELFFPKGTGRVTGLENFANCPYHHFLVNGLRLSPRDTYKIRSNVMGTIIHKIAEEITKQVIMGKQIDFKVVNGILRGHRLSKPVTNAIKRESRKIAKNITQIAEGYTPKYVEKDLVGNLCGITIKGKADRIDTNGDKALIVDYKTGSSTGKLQLPLYMHFHGSADRACYVMLSGSYRDNTVRWFKGDVGENVKAAEEAVKGILSGDISKKECDLCRYCVARRICR